jgi:hypothetical protein
LTVVGTQLGTSNRDTRIMSVRVGQRQGRSVPRRSSIARVTISPPFCAGCPLQRDSWDAAQRHSVVDHVDVLAARGSQKWKVAPAVALSVAQIRPPWASMMDFEIARPMPTPEGFVV